MHFNQMPCVIYHSKTIKLTCAAAMLNEFSQIFQEISKSFKKNYILIKSLILIFNLNFI